MNYKNLTLQQQQWYINCQQDFILNHCELLGTYANLSEEDKLIYDQQMENERNMTPEQRETSYNEDFNKEWNYYLIHYPHDWQESNEGADY